MLDADLAELYGVETRALIQAVKRNLSPFPADFIFQLTKEEFESLKSQIVISNSQSQSAISRDEEVAAIYLTRLQSKVWRCSPAS
jgi:ORF6N domain